MAKISMGKQLKEGLIIEHVELISYYFNNFWNRNQRIVTVCKYRGISVWAKSESLYMPYSRTVKRKSRKIKM